MKLKNVVTILLLMVASLQTVKAQKIILHMSDNRKVEYEISQLDSIAFTQAEPFVDDDHEWVDLGLPSGTLWATCNVGANSPEEYGDYFAWGETTSKSTYNWSTYTHCKGSSNTMTKYCSQSDYGYDSFIDTLTVLLPEDDAATANWGNKWQMPSLAQIEELINSTYTTTEWTSQKGVKGRKITSKSNGNTLFLPATGYYNDMGRYYTSVYGFFWSRSFSTSYCYSAYFLVFGSGASDIILSSDYRYNGYSVRPVRKK